MSSVSKAVIIVAGGSGIRMGGALPKQFRTIGGLPVLMQTILRFSNIENCRIVVVLPQSHVEYWQILCQDLAFNIKHTVCIGGENRFESVHAGLQHIGNVELVAIHDGVRPLVTEDLINRAFKDAKLYGAVIPVVTPTDSLREVDSDRSYIVDRSLYRSIQTPQVFHRKLIVDAYDIPYDKSYTDDASVVEAAAGSIYMCEGDYSNIKITTVSDLVVAEALLKWQESKQQCFNSYK